MRLARLGPVLAAVFLGAVGRAEPLPPLSPAYGPLADLVDTTWATELPPSKTGEPRAFEQTYSRDPLTGGIRLVTVASSGSRQVPNGIGTLVWDPANRQIHGAYSGPAGDSTAIDGRWEGQRLFLEGTLKVADNVTIGCRQILTLVAPDVQVQEVYQRLGEEWFLCGAFRFVRERPNAPVPGPTGPPYFEQPKALRFLRPLSPARERWGPGPATHTLYLQFVIETDGTVGQARAIGEGDTPFTAGAYAVTPLWLFQPAKLNGAKVRTLRFTPITFHRP